MTMRWAALLAMWPCVAAAEVTYELATPTLPDTGRPATTGTFSWTTTVTRADGMVFVDATQTGTTGFGMRGVSVSNGVETRYRVGMTSVQYERVRDGLMAPPDPRRIESLLPGMSVVLDVKAVEGFKLGGALRLLRAAIAETRGEGYVLSVTRLDEDGYVVQTGPSAMVERRIALGFGASFANVGVRFTNESTLQRLESWNLDRRVPGSLDVYASIVSRDRPSVPPSETIHCGRSALELSTFLSVGGVEWSADVSSQSSSICATEKADRSHSIEALRVVGGATASLRRDYSPDRRLLGEELTLSMPVTAETAEQLFEGIVGRRATRPERAVFEQTAGATISCDVADLASLGREMQTRELTYGTGPDSQFANNLLVGNWLEALQTRGFSYMIAAWPFQRWSRTLPCTLHFNGLPLDPAPVDAREILYTNTAGVYLVQITTNENALLAFHEEYDRLIGANPPRTGNTTPTAAAQASDPVRAGAPR